MPHGAQLHLSLRARAARDGSAFEHGATYFSISGGIRLRRRHRSRAVCGSRGCADGWPGNPDAPGFQLGGIGLEIKVKNVVEISAHGSFGTRRLPDGTRIEGAGPRRRDHHLRRRHQVGPDARPVLGHRAPAPGRALRHSSCSCSRSSARSRWARSSCAGIEALYAYGLMPKIEAGDREAGELKYYSVAQARPADRPCRRPGTSTARGRPRKDAWAFGLGVGLTITGCGSVDRAAGRSARASTRRPRPA